MSIETGVIALKSQVEDLLLNAQRLSNQAGGKNANLLSVEKWLDRAWAHLDGELRKIEHEQ